MNRRARTLCYVSIVGFLLILKMGCSSIDGPDNLQTPLPGYSPENFMLIPPVSVSMPAKFTMGDTILRNETPHQVNLTGRFHMASTEVTNGQFVAALQWAYNRGYVTVAAGFVRDNIGGSTQELLSLSPSFSEITFSRGIFRASFPEKPAVRISWYGAAAYCDWLSLHAGLPAAYDHSSWGCNNGHPYTAVGYRLPTEAEWEFACRAGTTTQYNTGDCLNGGKEANYNGLHPMFDCSIGSYSEGVADVGCYPPNRWGLLDMHGNVFEWCNDWYEEYTGDATNPAGADTGSGRVVRGGSWFDFGGVCRSGCRIRNGADSRLSLYGFRPVRSIN